MCFAIDMAEKLIDLCIAKAEDVDNPNPCYYADFYKLNKLLYIAQERMLSSHEGLRLFEDDIYAKACGPYINGLGVLFSKYGNEQIKTKTNNTKPIDDEREKILKVIVNDFGRFDRSQLGKITKATKPYTDQIENIYDSNGVEKGALIPISTLKFDDEDKKSLNSIL